MVGKSDYVGGVYVGAFCYIFVADRFYREQIGWGVLKAITFGGLGVWAIVDDFRYLYRFGKTGQWVKSVKDV